MEDNPALADPGYERVHVAKPLTDGKRLVLVSFPWYNRDDVWTSVRDNYCQQQKYEILMCQVHSDSLIVTYVQASLPEIELNTHQWKLYSLGFTTNINRVPFSGIWRRAVRCVSTSFRRNISRLFLAEIIFSTLKMEAICSSETSVETQRTTRHDITEYGTLHNHRCVNLKSYK
jgi:hypothetical protein